MDDDDYEIMFIASIVHTLPWRQKCELITVISSLADSEGPSASQELPAYSQETAV